MCSISPSAPSTPGSRGRSSSSGRCAISQRLERLLGRSSAEAEERALQAALAALPGHDRRLRTLSLAAVAAAIALLSAAAGALGVSLGTDRKAAPATPAVVQPRLLVPAGARGIAAVVDGKLWLSTRSGLRIEGLPVESAELSPHAWYVAAGIGRSLIVMAPNGTQAWSHAAGGSVAAIGWAPSGLRIAYVVRGAHGFQLRLIEGDGDHDQLIDPAVRPVAPTWRADSLAVAYVGAGGRAIVYDLAHRSHRVGSPGWARASARGRVVRTAAGIAEARTGRLLLRLPASARVASVAVR